MFVPLAVKSIGVRSFPEAKNRSPMGCLGVGQEEGREAGRARFVQTVWWSHIPVEALASVGMEEG